MSVAVADTLTGKFTSWGFGVAATPLRTGASRSAIRKEPVATAQFAEGSVAEIRYVWTPRVP